MKSSDHEDIVNIGSEARRILDGLHESQRSEPRRVDSPAHAGVLRIETSNEDDVEIEENSSRSQFSRREKLLFTQAISILRSQGKLIAKGANPSAQNSRTTESAFVVCDANGRVLGRVPLKMINRNALPREQGTKQDPLEKGPCTDNGLSPNVYSQTSGTHSVPIYFVHPNTGIIVKPNWTMVVLGSFLFGPIFFLAVGEVGHSILYIAAAIVFGLSGLGLIVCIAYAIAAQQIIRAKWRAKGYTEINESK